MLRELKAFYAKNKRSHLPWRKTRDPYSILVSEVMLQQTQVDRVIPYYKNFLKQFPTAGALAKAPLSKVLRAWQGLGYNRRAKYLQDAAKILAKEEWQGQKLPGVGPYTMGAVEAFAFNKPSAFIETNIRTVLFHHMPKPKNENVMIYHNKFSDSELLPMVAEALRKSKMEPREFYWAMMDYGSYLKRQGVKLNHQSKHYAKQSKFEGSARQKRAAALRDALKRGVSEKTLAKLLK